jgi:Beta-propeller repeat
MLKNFIYLLMLSTFFSGCDVKVDDGVFTCDPENGPACPDGYKCIKYGIEGIWKCHLNSTPECGDGKLDTETGELCDIDVFSASATPTAAMCGGESFRRCTANCVPVCVSCGNFTIDTSFNEVCDGTNLNQQSCETLGYYGGTLQCSLNCLEFDYENCTGYCGDQIINDGEGEVCDTNSFAGADCSDSTDSMISDDGTILCSDTCQLDFSQCLRCGDGEINVIGEECDGTELNGETCDGTVVCNNNCTLNYENCNTCGNGIVDDGEECDGTALNGSVCGDFGFSNGELLCDDNCNLMNISCYSIYDSTATKVVGNSIVADNNGFIYITGKSTIIDSFGNIFVAKYTLDGSEVWFNEFDTGLLDTGHDIVFDGTDYLYIAGESAFDSSDSTPVIIKLNTDGVLQWGEIKTYPHNNARYFSLKIYQNSIYATGVSDASFIITRVSTSSGLESWAKIYASTAYDNSKSITGDSSGNIYICGKTNGNFDGNHSSNNAPDIIIAKYNSDGTNLWKKQIGDLDDAEYCRDIILNSNYLYLTGFTTSNNMDIIIAKFSTEGTEIWTKIEGGGELDMGNSITTDLYNNLLITGETRGNLEPDYLIGSGTHNSFVMKFNEDGTKLWVKQWSPDTNISGNDIVVDGSNIFTVVCKNYNSMQIIKSGNLP